MTHAPIPTAVIAARRHEIEAEMDRLRAEMGAFQTAIETYRQELAELEVAERVWTRLITQSTPGITNTKAEVTASTAPAQGRRKPAGTPTVTDMIAEALRDARDRGLHGLEPKEMASYIAKRWWPGVKITDVGPIAWRMATKQGQLEKDGATYSLPQSSRNLSVATLVNDGDDDGLRQTAPAAA